MTTFTELLTQHKAAQLTRQRIKLEQHNGPYSQHNNQKIICFNRNDYLGLSQHPQVKQASIDAIIKYGTSTNSSQLVAGYLDIHQKLEQELANYLHQPQAIILPTGTMANYALMSCLSKISPHFIADKLIHASLIDGINLANGKLRRFPHNNYLIADKWLHDHEHCPHIITEGVFSMDGDTSPLNHLAELAHNHNANLIIDDSHGLGVLGEHGTPDHYSINPKEITAITGSFGKALGSQGGFIAGSTGLIEAISQFARPFIYTTSLAPAAAAAALAALQIIKTEPSHQKKLHHIIQYCQRTAKQLNIPISTNKSAIQTIIVPNISKLHHTHQALLKAGCFTGMIRPPTVPKNTSRIRISLSANHTEEHIDKLLNTLKLALEQ